MMIRQFLRTRILPHFGGDLRYAQLAFIGAYDFPDAVQVQFAEEWDDLSADERAEAFDGLRDYFAIRAADPDRPAAMPSRIVDEAWRIFNQFTDDYSNFCQRAFGRRLPHAAAGANDDLKDIKQTWRIACARDGISSKQATRLPRLFALDRRFNIPNGRYYVLNETDADRVRNTLGLTAMVFMASTLGGIESWQDPIFSEMHADAHITLFGGSDVGSGDLGGAAGGIGNLDSGGGFSGDGTS